MKEDPLVQWMDALIDYAKDWDNTFQHKKYFTQEYWYLLVSCYRAHKNGGCLTVGQALSAMKAGTTNTRLDRLEKAIGDGYLCRQESGEDGREKLVVPTGKLIELLDAHLSRTRDIALTKLQLK